MSETTQVANHLRGKVVVITGAGSGFGRLLAQQASALGALIVGGDINDGTLQETIGLVTANQGQGVGLATDVTDAAQMATLAAKAVSEFGAIDIWINNAGVMPLAFHRDHTQALAAWHQCIDINIKGVVNGISACHDLMLAQGRGHVVNLSSIYGNFPVAGAGVYGATKAAVNFLSESLRVESQGKIKVTTVRPTGVPNTNLGAGIVNPEAIVGILGQNAPAYLGTMTQAASGSLAAEALSVDEMSYYALEPEYLAQQIVHAINQPWGVAISEVTVRASGDGYVL